LKQSLTNNIFLTGASGFVGNNLISFLNNQFVIHKYQRNSRICIDQSIVIHLAGKAHDLKKVANPIEYYEANYELTQQLFDAFLGSSATVFVFMSSAKTVVDAITGVLTEDVEANPQTHYGKSKLLAEQYILSKNIPEGKRVYILRPCMIHGPGNKGNLNLLYQLVTKNLPWPLGAFQNQRSFCSIENVCYVIQQIVERDDIPSGVYNVSDDEALSTNELIQLIAATTHKKTRIFAVPKKIIYAIAHLGDVFRLPLNTERLGKLTENFVVSNTKIKAALQIKKLPISSKDGVIKTINSFI
jgi:nucleoside-diphosphate-sugar epimerase